MVKRELTLEPQKVANFLVRTFDCIFIPTFETSQMVIKLTSSIARNLLSFAHYHFKEYLKARGQQAMCEVSEAYTSKTCSYYGTIHKIGGKKRMQCQCGAECRSRFKRCTWDFPACFGGYALISSKN